MVVITTKTTEEIENTEVKNHRETVEIKIQGIISVITKSQKKISDHTSSIENSQILLEIQGTAEIYKDSKKSYYQICHQNSYTINRLHDNMYIC